MAISTSNFFVASFTINVCVLSSIVLPAVSRPFLLRFLKGRYLLQYKESIQENPAFFRRLYSDLILSGTAMVAGILLLSTSNVLNDPFFAFSDNIAFVFSVAVGWHMFKIFQNFCDADKSAKHWKFTTVLRLVAVFLYSSILEYKQCTLLGTVGLVVEGHALFFKLCKLWRVVKVSDRSKVYFISALVTCISAIILRAAFPMITLAVMTWYHWEQILLMDYVPLAVFFFCLVLYTAANVWLIKKAIDPFFKPKATETKRQDFPLYTINSTVPCFIHNDLWSTQWEESCASI